MELKNKTIEVCLGVGLDQLTPEYLIIEISNESEKDNAEQNEKQSEDIIPKKRGRKPKQNNS